MQNPHSKPAAVLLSVAGSDCSGGAGLQADLKTAGVFGVFCATVITAITAQNPQALHRVFSLPADQVKAQWDAVVQGLPISAVKLGMLGDGATARAVAENLAALRKTHPRLPIVIDPVLRASSGGDLSGPEVLSIYRDALFPLASLITPNIDEAARLLDCNPARNATQMREQAQALLALGSQAVLLKGGHLQADNPHEQQLAVDLLVDAEGAYPFSSPRLQAIHSHGGGCTLASAIAAGLAQGLQLRQAVAAAKTFIQGALLHSPNLHLAEHNGPLHHFYQSW